MRWAAVTGEPPISFTDDKGGSIGMDPDLARAIAEQMKRDVEVIPEAFQNSLLGLDAKRLDVVGGASLNKERMEKYEMVPYSLGAYGFLTRADGPDIGDDMETDLCGLTIAMNAGDVFIPMLRETGEKCVAAGKENLTVAEFPDATANGLAVQSKRADAWAGPTIALGWAAKQDSGKWKRTGAEWGQVTIGFVTNKGSGLAAPMAAAINELIENGTYKKIMASYGLEANMITESAVNPPMG
jgi:polar amino acid transport system substrate-binding protein